MTHKANNRRYSRRHVYLGEGIKVYLKDDADEHILAGEAIDFSPWGMSILVAHQNLSVYPKVGDLVRIHYTTRERKNSFVRGTVANVSPKTIMEVEHLRYGIEFQIDKAPVKIGKGIAHFFDIPELFGPHAWSKDPFFFQEKIIYKIISFHAKGLKMHTSARNKTFLPNLPLTLKISVPIQGEFEVNVKILSTEVSDLKEMKDRFEVNVEFISPTSSFMQMMVEYILFCGVEVTPQELRNEKLPVTIIEKSLTFNYANNDEEMEKVILLRRTSLFEEIDVLENSLTLLNKTPNKNTYGGFIDIFDEYSRQIVCKIGKKPVACLRLIFNNKNKSHSEICSFVDSLPDWIWSKKFVEISLFAWDKDYREADIFINMIRNVVRIAIESSHSHIITIAPQALKQLYLKVGFQPVELKWKNNINLKKSQETPMILDAKSILMGNLEIEKTVWNKIYASIAEHLGYKK